MLYLKNYIEFLSLDVFSKEKITINTNVSPWKYNLSSGNMSENPLLYALLSLQVVYC